MSDLNVFISLDQMGALKRRAKSKSPHATVEEIAEGYIIQGLHAKRLGLDKETYERLTYQAQRQNWTVEDLMHIYIFHGLEEDERREDEEHE